MQKICGGFEILLLVYTILGKLYGIVQRVLSVFVSGFGEDQVKGLGVTQGAGGEI